MEKSFLKGLIIASILSTMFWVGIYKAFTSETESPTTIETLEQVNENDEATKIVAAKESL